MYTDEDLLMISGIQHYFYCKRQWAMIHIENQWEENLHTTKGEIMHERVDDPFVLESRGDLFISRSVPLVSYELGFYGYSDAIEYVLDETGVYIESKKNKYRIIPVEYKVGKPKQDECDAVQLCLQSICLEEMFNTSISEGYLFYGKTRHRQKVTMNQSIRDLVKEVAFEMHNLLEKGKTPNAVYSTKCDRCSLYNICVPKLSVNYRDVEKYIFNTIHNTEV